MVMSFDELNAMLLDEGICKITCHVKSDDYAKSMKENICQLIDEARYHIPARAPKEAKLDILLQLFYRHWGFQCAGGVYSMVDALWPDKVLTCRHGTPMSLGFLLLTIARGIDVELTPVLFPTQLILKAEWMTGNHWGINPQNGDKLSLNELAIWLRGYFGIAAKLNEYTLQSANNGMFIYKLLQGIKYAYMREDQLEQALKVSELVVQLNPSDPYVIRDQGLIYAQLECSQAAIKNLRYFVEQCPEDPSVELIKMQIQSIGHPHITLH